MKCRKCETKLKDYPNSMSDFSSFFTGMKQMYCENKECEHFGFLTVAGVPEPEEVNTDDTPTPKE